MLLNDLYKLKMDMYASFADKKSSTVSLALLASALIIAVIALFSHNTMLKAIVLAYVILP